MKVLRGKEAISELTLLRWLVPAVRCTANCLDLGSPRCTWAKIILGLACSGFFASDIGLSRYLWQAGPRVVTYFDFRPPGEEEELGDYADSDDEGMQVAGGPVQQLGQHSLQGGMPQPGGMAGLVEEVDGGFEATDADH